MTRLRWDKYFMNISRDVARRSTCIRKDRKIGAVVVSPRYEIVGTGYNGNPRGMKHCSEIGCVREKENIPSGERIETCTGVHAEMNALLQAGPRAVEGTMYTRFNPCVICSAMLVNAGIKRVVYTDEYPNKKGLELLKEFGIVVEQLKDETVER